MKRTRRRFLVILLSLVLVFGTLPAAVFADPEGGGNSLYFSPGPNGVFQIAAGETAEFVIVTNAAELGYTGICYEWSRNLWTDSGFMEDTEWGRSIIDDPTLVISKMKTAL